jgi:hypothetical protein
MPKVKGAAIVESVRVLRRHEDSARKHLPPALHHDLEERVLAASWDPAEDQIPLTRAVARVLGEPEHGFFEKARRIAVGYLGATFEISGYKDVQVEKQACCVDGASECAWSVRWRN